MKRKAKVVQPSGLILVAATLLIHLWDSSSIMFSLFAIIYCKCTIVEYLGWVEVLVTTAVDDVSLNSTGTDCLGKIKDSKSSEQRIQKADDQHQMDMVHIAGVGDYPLADAAISADPCPLPSPDSNELKVPTEDILVDIGRCMLFARILILQF
ncbi:hypothetical protein MKW92_018218 [Papaver armeniacum]|nr:hypothetical protein MKW92_018218 [Papaver armeniacum]